MSKDENSKSDFHKEINREAPVVMPQAPGIEKSLLSMMVADPTNIIGLCHEGGINEDFFYIPAHRILWNLFDSRYDDNKSLDITSIDQALSDAGQLESVGGHAGLMDILTYATSTALFSSHFEILKEKYVRRSMILAANKIHETAHDEGREVTELLDSAEQDVMQIRNRTASSDKWDIKRAISEAVSNVERMMSRDGAILGLPTGYDELDLMTNGLKPGELFVIAARPSMGKTSFLLNVVEHLVLDVKKPVLVFSCEMPSVQLVERLLFAKSGVSKKEVRSKQGKLTKEQMNRLKEAINAYKESRLIIDDTAAISISELRAKARRIRKENPDLCAIGIDYLQLMRSHTKQAQNSREREIAEISGGLKGLAKELKLPIIVLAQLNRGPENRTGKNKGLPMMSDLRESGAIEQDADMVGLLYRSAYYAEDDEERKGAGTDATLVLAKNRNGPTGDVKLSFEAELMRFNPRTTHDEA